MVNLGLRTGRRAEAFTKDHAERLKGEDYTLKQTFRSNVETKVGKVQSSATRADHGPSRQSDGGGARQ